MTIAIKHKTSGEIQFVESMAGYSSNWTQLGPALPTGIEPNILSLVSGAWVEDAAKVEVILLASIKSDAERRKMNFLSAGGAKKAEYAEKHAEVAFWDSLAGTLNGAVAALGLMTPAARASKFPYALADAAAFKDTVSAAIERFRKGMDASQKVPAIAGEEARVCAAIKVATTAAAKRTAAAAVSWPT